MKKEESVIYNGVRMAKSWPRKIQAAQKITVVCIAEKNYPRIRYGDEKEDWGANDGLPCGDCAVLKGQFHVVGCDIERCPCCRDQLISCDCDMDED